MIKKLKLLIVINYIIIIIYLLYSFFTQMKFLEFLNRIVVLLVSLNLVIFMIQKAVQNKISVDVENKIDISISPSENEVNSILEEMNQDLANDKADIEKDAEFKEWDFTNSKDN